jgi:hypothetical protein
MPEFNPYEAPQEDLTQEPARGDGASLQNYSQAILFAFVTQGVCLWMSSIFVRDTFGPEGGVDIIRFLFLLFMLGSLAISVVAMLLLVVRFRSPWLLIAQLLLVGVPLIYYLRGPGFS